MTNAGRDIEVDRAHAVARVDPMTRALFLRRSAVGVAGLSSLSALLAACGGNDDGASTNTTGDAGKPPSRPVGVVNVALEASPVTLDPTIAFSVAELSVITNVYEGLVVYNEDYTELAPALATEWASSDDAREWTFTLRPDVLFHDGAELDSTAVRKTIEYLLRETSAYGFAIGTPEVDDSDPTKLVMKYKDPAPDVARNWTLLKVISPKLLTGSGSAREKRVADTPVGTGPFMWASANRGQSITLEANERYWGEGPYLKNVEFRIVPDESARTAALRSGDVDLILQVPPRSARAIESSGQLQVVSRPSWTTVTLNMDCSQAPFDNPDARKAVAYGVDRQAIVDNVLLERAKVADSAVPEGVYGRAVPATQYSHDLERARGLLQGVDGSKRVRLTLTRSAALANEITQALAGQLREVGFDTEVAVLDQATISDDVAARVRKYNMQINELGAIEGGTIHILSGSFTTASRFSNKEIDALVETVATNPDGPEREEAIAEFQTMIADLVPSLPLWVPERVDAVAKKVQGYSAPANVFTVLGDSYVREEG